MPASYQQPEIPTQRLLTKDLFQVYSITGFSHELSHIPHRHDFYMLIWVTAGSGRHLIDFKPFDMCPGRVFYLRPGQVHQLLNAAHDGWLVVFEESLVNKFTKAQTLEEQFAVFDYFNQAPYVDLSQETEVVYNGLFQFLLAEREKDKPNLAVVPHYLYLLLLHGHNLHLQQHTQQALPGSEEARIRELRILIEKKFKEEHEMEFYCRTLGISAKKLNEVTRHVFGKTVHQLLQERLLTESKYMLASSGLSVKEIAYELGFNDPAYFGRFFKKNTNLTPAAYKEART